MSVKAGLKAGLIGAAVLVVSVVISRLLRVSGALMYANCALNSVLYIATGILAGLYVMPPRTTGKGAGAGAIAGLISGGISSAVSSAILVVQTSAGGGIPGLSPQQMQQLAESGLSPSTFTGIGIVCGLAGGLAIGAALAAAGGTILSALKAD
jgi:hypothetical protein